MSTLGELAREAGIESHVLRKRLKTAIDHKQRTKTPAFRKLEAEIENFKPKTATTSRLVPWAPWEDQLLIEGRTVDVVRSLTGRSKGSVYSRRVALKAGGVALGKISRGIDWTPEEEELVMDLNRTLEELAIELGRSPKAISMRRARLRRKGGIIQRRRWTPEEDEAILNQNGKSTRQLGKELNRSSSAINARRRKLQLTKVDAQPDL